MQFVVDENVERQVVERLRLEKHQVWYIPELASGIANGAVLEFANRQGAVLITADKSDFGELIFRSQRTSVGLVLLRFPPVISPDQKAESVAIFVAEYGERLLGSISVLTQQNVRIRPLPQHEIPD